MNREAFQKPVGFRCLFHLQSQRLRGLVSSVPPKAGFGTRRPARSGEIRAGLSHEEMPDARGEGEDPDARGEARTGLAAAGGSFLLGGAKVL